LQGLNGMCLAIVRTPIHTWSKCSDRDFLSLL
jgi:hypothetical protein